MKYSGIRSVAINAVHLVGARTLTMLVRGIYIIVLARYLGPEIYGLFAYGQSWYVAFLPLTGLGLAQILSREVGRNRGAGAEVVKQALALRTMSALVGAVVCGFSGWVVEADPVVRQLLLMFSLALAGRGIASWAEQVFIAYEVSRYALQQEAVFRMAEVAVGVSVLSLGGGVTAVAAVHALIWWLQAVRGFFIVRCRLVSTRSEGAWRGLGHLAAQGVPLCLSSFFLGWLLQGPLVLFRYITASETILGQLALVMQALTLVYTVPLSIGMAALPVLSRSALRQDGKNIRFAEIMLRVAFLSGGMAGLCGMAFGPWLFALIFGNSYEVAGHLLETTLWLLIPFAAAIAISQVLIGRGQFVSSSLCAFAGAFVLTLSLPPIAAEMGPYGALLATGMGMGVWAVSLIMLLARSSELNLDLAVFRPAVVVLLALGVYIGLNNVSVWLAFLTSLLALFGGALAFDMLTPEEKFALRICLHSLKR